MLKLYISIYILYMNIVPPHKENKEKYNLLRIAEYTDELETYYKETFHNTRPENIEKYSGHRITYGELLLDGLKQIIKHLSEHGIKYNNFIDIGCGKGRAVLYMAAFTKKSIGIELVSERVNHAKDVIAKMSDEYKYFLNNVQIIEGDFTEQNYADIFDETDRIFIWISNLCFSSEINAKILAKIHQAFGNRFVICCSQELPHNDSLKKLSVEPIQMSWDNKSNVHFYIPVS